MEEAKNYPLNKKALFILILILVLGSFLRLYNLGKESLWCDEFLSLGVSSFSNISDVIFKNFYGHVDVFPPAYQILLHFVVKYIGNSEFILRLPSCIFGILSVYITFLLGRCLYTYREGLIAASFMAVLHVPIQYSQEVRPYSMLLFFSLLSIYFWVKLLRIVGNNQTPSCCLLFGYITSAILVSYTHYFGFYFVALQGLTLVLFSFCRLKAFWSIFLSYSFIFISYMPWVFVASRRHFVQVSKIWNNTGILNHKISFILLDLYPYFLLQLNGALVLKWFIIFMYIILFFRYLYYVFNPKSRNSSYHTNLISTLMLTTWIIAPLIIWLLISMLRDEMQIAVTQRNLIIYLPLVCLLVAHSITQLPIKVYKKILITLGVLSFLLYRLIFTFEYYSSPRNQQFKEIAEEIIANDSKYSDSVIIGWGGIPIFFNYYFEKNKFNKRIDFSGYRKDNMGCLLPNLNNVKKFITAANKRYVWVCIYKQFDLPLQNFLKENYKLVNRKFFNESSVWLFEKKDI